MTNPVKPASRSIQETGTLAPEKLDPSETARRAMDPAFSRNQNFYWYERQGRGVITFRRFVQGLLADLQLAEPTALIEFEADPENARVWVELHIARFRATHRGCLLEAEFEALKTHPEIGPKLVLKGSVSEDRHRGRAQTGRQA